MTRPLFHRVVRNHTQAGQAVVEALVSLLALAVLWMAVIWLGRIQDLALHASHASRYSAFTASRDDTVFQSPSGGSSFMTSLPQQWVSKAGTPLLGSVYNDSGGFHRGIRLSDLAQPGGRDPDSIRLRNEWKVADPGVAKAFVIFTPFGQKMGSQASLLGRDFFVNAYPRISRHTVIATGAGHASSDSDAADRTAASAYGWSDAANASYQLGKRIERNAGGVDEAWRRPRPVFDWQHPWSNELPAHHVH